MSTATPCESWMGCETQCRTTDHKPLLEHLLQRWQERPGVLGAQQSGDVGVRVGRGWSWLVVVNIGI